ncbi:hypothetical protein F2P81_006202 [Scophthalmus maximus]|uniref:Uncharacterized protein n=1 Tax=Scophthalmus maximus TaxID=52904 RepID=A0A6A4TFY6_SCOMX|nr:hypothetical protein F2P81_006202 [Scophthalmus maximus]
MKLTLCARRFAERAVNQTPPARVRGRGVQLKVTAGAKWRSSGLDVSVLTTTNDQSEKIFSVLLHHGADSRRWFEMAAWGGEQQRCREAAEKTQGGLTVLSGRGSTGEAATDMTVTHLHYIITLMSPTADTAEDDCISGWNDPL